MKKIMAIMLALIMAVAALSACGGNGGDSSPADNPASTASTEDNSAGASASSSGQTVGQTVDMDDFSNYFAVIDGVTYYLPDGCTLQDLLDAGYTVDPELDINQPVNYGVYVGENFTDVYVGLYKTGVEKVYFRAYPHNPNADPIPLKDCAIYGISFFNREADISIVGGLSIGSAPEDFAVVFGSKPGEEVPGYTDTYMVKYASSDGYGYITFSYKESTGEIKDISVSYISPDM